MCAQPHTRTHTSLSTCANATLTHTCPRLSTRMCLHTHPHLHTRTCLYTHMCQRLCTYTCLHTYVHALLSIHANAYMNIYAHIHTQTHPAREGLPAPTRLQSPHVLGVAGHKYQEGLPVLGFEQQYRAAGTPSTRAGVSVSRLSWGTVDKLTVRERCFQDMQRCWRSHRVCDHQLPPQHSPAALPEPQSTVLPSVRTLRAVVGTGRVSWLQPQSVLGPALGPHGGTPAPPAQPRLP